MLGVSIYLGTKPLDEQKAYLKKMKAAGFQSIFTSLHIPEMNAIIYKKELSDLGSIAKELGMELMVDVSPHSLQNIGLPWENAAELAEWGVSGLRLDYGIEPETAARLSDKLTIALNASTVTKEALVKMKACRLRTSAIEAWHNYYPRPETGLGKADFIERNNWLKEEGLSVVSFIPGDGERRGLLYKQLPTLEKHRGYPPFAAFLELKAECGADKVIIGDPGISEAALAQFKAYGEGMILVRALADQQADSRTVEKAAGVHTNRPDAARDVIRSVESRYRALEEEITIPPCNTVERPAGTITIDNEKYLRYQGEIQLTKKDLPADRKVNVLGHIIEKDLPLLAYINSSQTFRIQWIGVSPPSL